MSKHVVMICTSARGGMRSVVEGYRADGVFARWNVKLLSPHVEGALALRVYTALRVLIEFAILILLRRVSLVHCHAAMKGSFWRKSIFALLAKGAGLPVIFHLHGSEMKSFVDRQAKPLRQLISWILERQSVVVVLSESWRTYVAGIAPRANVRILPNYVKVPDLAAKPAQSADNEVEVLFLGVVGTRKGVYDLIPAFGAARTAVPALRLIIGGNGEVERASALVVQLGLQQSVTFAGWISGDEKLRQLQRAKIYVLPSYNEGLPVSLLEAMSWQIPVISTRVGGIPELVRDDLDGVLIEAGDQAALTAALIKLAGNADLRAAMGRSAGLQVQNNFSDAVVLPLLEKIYHELVFGERS